jgi:hypothetical protein
MPESILPMTIMPLLIDSPATSCTEILPVFSKARIILSSLAWSSSVGHLCAPPSTRSPASPLAAQAIFTSPSVITSLDYFGLSAASNDANHT